MGTQNPSYVAGGDIRPCRFVTPSSTAYIVVESNADDHPCGISQEGFRGPNTPDITQTLAAVSGDQLEVHGEGDICLLELAETVTAGTILKPNADGEGVAATANGDPMGARALEGGDDGDKIRVQVLTDRGYA